MSGWLPTHVSSLTTGSEATMLDGTMTMIMLLLLALVASVVGAET
jgi:hypothetical protein